MSLYTKILILLISLRNPDNNPNGSRTIYQQQDILIIFWLRGPEPRIERANNIPYGAEC